MLAGEIGDIDKHIYEMHRIPLFRLPFAVHAAHRSGNQFKQAQLIFCNKTSSQQQGTIHFTCNESKKNTTEHEISCPVNTANAQMSKKSHKRED